MKKALFLILSMIAPAISLVAQPVTSTSTTPVWYMIKCVNGGGFITTQGVGNILKTAKGTGVDAQFFRFEDNGDNTVSIVSKDELTLYAESATRSSKIYAATSASSNQKFKIVKKTNGYEIQPSASSVIAFNQFGGTAIGNQIGLWDTNDSGNLMTFLSENDPEVIALVEAIQDVKEQQEQMASATPKGFHVIPFPNKVVLANKLEIDKDAVVATINKASTILAGTVDNITFVTDNSLPSEGYKLNVTESNAVTITSSAPRGAYYALMTLKQMALTDGYFACNIEDAPKLEHRGLMLDIARHFFDMDEVKKVIDVMSLYKLNRFHWHLTDDQGWRVEIPEYPLLTEVGAIRKSSLVNSIGSNGLYDDTEYGRGCYYTLDQLREVVEYAQAKQVDIMPEIDLPGHMVAAIASYPELSCDPSKNYEVRVEAGISSDLLAVHKSGTMDFLKCVLGHIADVFPFKYIHIGGDECRVTSSSWQTLYNNNDRDFRNFMNEYNLSSVNDVQAWLADTLGRWLTNNYNKEIIVWNEVVSHWRDGYLKPAGVMAYSAGENWESKAAAKGMKSISTPTFPLYFDMMQGDTKLEDPYSGGYGNNSVPTVYNYSILGAYGSYPDSYCLGAQGNLWTESTNKNIEVEHNLFPRGIALAENCWMPESAKLYSNFRTRLQSHAPILKSMDVKYATQEIDEKTTYADLVKEYYADYHADEIGFPDAASYARLKKAIDANASEAAMKNVANQFKMKMTLPTDKKLVKIISAATKWDQRYLGSSVYLKDSNSLHIHYTEQFEPEELFYMDIAGSKRYNLINVVAEKKIDLADGKASLVDPTSSTTFITLSKPGTTTSGSTTVDYKPGVLLISQGNNALCTDNSGNVYSGTKNLTYCYPTTWYIFEVKDFDAYNEGLVRKCEQWIRKGTSVSVTAAALSFLNQYVYTPARQAAEVGNVSENTYMNLVGLYRIFLNNANKTTMPDITDVKELEMLDNFGNSALYDLSGRLVGKPSQGIYIQNGKKVML
ncbi:MAG: beta-N-acetylhexosaminidase [Bacteroidaceae bacterium]|nr:beta-N-acetylhexosaminidase [Bacteroidaceae bacterium]